MTVGEIKGMKNLTIVKVEFGWFDIKVLKLGRRRSADGGGGGGEEEEKEKEEKRRGKFKEHAFWVWKWMGPLKFGDLVYLRDKIEQPRGFYLG